MEEEQGEGRSKRGKENLAPFTPSSFQARREAGEGASWEGGNGWGEGGEGRREVVEGRREVVEGRRERRVLLPTDSQWRKERAAHYYEYRGDRREGKGWREPGGPGFSHGEGGREYSHGEGGRELFSHGEGGREVRWRESVPYHGHHSKEDWGEIGPGDWDLDY